MKTDRRDAEKLARSYRSGDQARDPKYANSANNHLLVSIAQASGVDVNTFGKGSDSTFTTGALAGLK